MSTTSSSVHRGLGIGCATSFHRKGRRKAGTAALALRILIPALVCMAGVAAGGTSWNAQRTGNPLLPGYFADPSARKFGDTYYVYATPDGWDVGRGPAGAWSSKDFVHWTWHPMNWPQTEFKWAPSVVEFEGRYYMFNSVPCQTWAAVADHPLGPWTNLVGEGPMMLDQTPKETIVLDAEIFIDDDGQIYKWYGTWWRPTVVKLKSDMHTLDGDPIQYFKNPTNPEPPMGEIPFCMEAPYMFERNGIYYLMYSDGFCENSTYNVKYVTSTSPLGPFTYDPDKNPILETTDDGTIAGPGHHTILEDGDKIYIVYHRHDNPKTEVGIARQVAVDALHFLEDGSIEKVVPSHSGVGFLAPSTKRDTDLALGAAATASSSAGNLFLPAHATDHNNGTLWKASGDTWPQWLQVDLGQVQTFQRTETEFQYPQVVNRYLIEISVDSEQWMPYADRRENRQDNGIMIDEGQAEARYVRITIYGNNSGRRDQVAALWGFKVYDGIDKPNQAPVVEMEPDVTGSIRFPTLVAHAAAHDDGLPHGPVRYRWSKRSGPGDAHFAHPDRLRSDVTFSAPGTYVLQMEADDGELQSTGTVTYTILPPGDRLIHYGFDESYGRIVEDQTENNQHGVFREGVTRSLGISGKALNMTSAGFVAVPPLGEVEDLTLAAWVNPHALPGEGASLFSSIGGGAGSIRTLLGGDGRIQFTAGGLPVATSRTGFDPEDLGWWKHLAIVYDASARKITFYIDGKRDSECALQSAPALRLTDRLGLGGGVQGVPGFHGEVDEFQAFARVLSADEIAAMAATPAFTRISEIGAMDDGTPVTLMAKSVIFAPADPLTSQRTTSYFYIAEAGGRAGIGVQHNLAEGDKVVQDRRVSLTGVVRVGPTGERYIEISSIPDHGAPHKNVAYDVSIAQAKAYAGVLSPLVNLRGTVAELSPDRRSFTLRDAETGAALPVRIEEGVLVKPMEEGHVVGLTAVLAVGDAAKADSRVLLVRDLVRIDPPPTPELAVYRFEEADGNRANDASGNRKHATLVNDPQRVEGRAGKALRFDGSHYVVLPDLGIQPALTVTAWINLASLGPDNFGPSILHTDSWAPGDLHMFVIREDRRIGVAVGGSIPGDLHSQFTVTDERFGQWIHVAFTYDSQAREMALYINGQLEQQKDLGTPRFINLARSRIGAWGESRMFDGRMEDFRLYDTAFDAERIALIYRGE